MERILDSINIWIIIASFLIGCTGPIIFYLAIKGILHIQEKKEKASVMEASLALIISLGSCSAFLLYIAKHASGAGPVIVIMFIVGFGLVRLTLEEI